MRRPKGAYVVGEATANLSAPDRRRPPDVHGAPRALAPLAHAVVLVWSARDMVWRREGAEALRVAGATVRVASGAAELRKALADGAVTQLVLDEDGPGASSAAAPWPDGVPMLRRLPGESGQQSVRRLLEGLPRQGTMST